MAIVLVKVSVSEIADDGGLSHAIAAFVLSSSMALGAAFRYRARARMRELDQAKLLERERLDVFVMRMTLRAAPPAGQ